MATFVSSLESSLGYAGWRVVLAAHFGAMMSFGSLLVFRFSVFLKPLSAEFGWGREEVSSLDRGEPRRVVLP